MSIEYKGPVVMLVMDGLGLSDFEAGNAVMLAYDKHLSDIMRDYPSLRLQTGGRYVGMPINSAGNSEVGHNALGSGQIIDQGAERINKQIESGEMFDGEVWKALVKNVKDSGGKLHFIGILSDGNRHSNIAHLLQMLDRAASDGVKKVRVHVILDGKDVPATSATIYIDQLESKLSEINAGGKDYKIASGGGREKISTDKYGQNYDIVVEGWKTHVLGIGENAKSVNEFIEAKRYEVPGILDMNMPAFVIADDNGKPVGKIEDGDSVVLFNFKANRMVELAEAFETGKDFNKFDRGTVPKIYFAGMVEYNPALNLPKNFLVGAPDIKNTMVEFLNSKDISSLTVTESAKFEHLTYYFNGNHGKFDSKKEETLEIKNVEENLVERPWMKSAEVADAAIKAIEEGKHKFIRVNLVNGDMVGRLGNLEAAIVAVEAVDLALGRLMEAVDKAGGVLIVTADHGKAENVFVLDKAGELILENGKPIAQIGHTDNPVPFVVYDNTENKMKYELKISGDYGLANVAATVVGLLGLTPPEGWQESMMREKDNVIFSGDIG